MNYSDPIIADSPNDIPMNETGFFKYLEEHGFVKPKYERQAQTALDDIKPYLESMGFEKGKDNLDPHVLSNLKHIWNYARQAIRRGYP